MVTPPPILPLCLLMLALIVLFLFYLGFSTPFFFPPVFFVPLFVRVYVSCTLPPTQHLLHLLPLSFSCFCLVVCVCDSSYAMLRLLSDGKGEKNLKNMYKERETDTHKKKKENKQIKDCDLISVRSCYVTFRKKL